MTNEPEKPRRGRPRDEHWHERARRLSMMYSGERATRKMKDVLACAWVAELFEDKGGAPLPQKPALEIGRLLYTDPEVLKMAQALSACEDEAIEATAAEVRSKILARLPAVRELYEHALALKAKGWNAGAIAAGIRAVNALYREAQERAVTLVGPQEDVARLTAQLLEGALSLARKNGLSAGRIKGDNPAAAPAYP
jgi:hypothetical protein